MPTPPILSIERLTVRFGARAAVDELSIEVGRGEIFGLIGPNGSGKSTTLSVVAGLIDGTAGVVRVLGETLRENPGGYAHRIGIVPQSSALYDELTAARNLHFFGGLYGLRGRELARRVERVLHLVDLADAAATPVRVLSGGQRQRINLAAALLHDPPLLLLDEPTAALDGPAREGLFGHLHRLREEGRSIVLTSHHLDEVERWCDRVGVLEEGRLVACGGPADVLHAHPRQQVLELRLAHPLDAIAVRSLRDRLRPSVELVANGVAVRISAADATELTGALASLIKLGATPRELWMPGVAVEPGGPRWAAA